MIVQDQSATLAFLKNLANIGGPEVQVSTTNTHMSFIVIVGQRVFKLKRAVSLPYVDFSTPSRRLAACQREFELNRRTAAMLYVSVRRITLEADGQLMFDGLGELVDAVVEMVRFNEDALFSRMAVCGRLKPELLAKLARVVAAFHADADVDHRRAGASHFASVLDANERSLFAAGVFAPSTVAALAAGLRAAFVQHEALLDAREREGKVRHCHGDLHLSNICLVEGTPVLFDCIEFDEELAMIDVLYDLAFIVMDLWHYNLESGANLVFNRYFDACDELDGLALMPFFMALRATIRAHVSATQSGEAAGRRHETLMREAQAYIALALQFLAPTRARLVAIGGLSGTGKSTVAAAVADRIGAVPGARILASDRIRKQIHGVQADVRLPADAYSPEASEQVYAFLLRSARKALACGHAVLADAVFNRMADRERIELVAHDAKVPFTGLWLHARPDTLIARVEARQGDASDADANIVRAQLANQNGPTNWVWIETGDDFAVTVARVAEVLGRKTS